MPFLDALPFIGSLASSVGLGALSGATAKKGRWSQLDRLTPDQKNLVGQAGNLGLQQLQNPTAGFQPIANQARNQFNNQTIPGLAERFTSLGGSGQRSSAFQGALGSAGSDLESQLAGMQAQYGQRQQALGQNLLGMGLTPQFENVYSQGGPSFLSGLFGGASKGIGSLGNLQMLQYFLSDMKSKSSNKGSDSAYDQLSSMFSPQRASINNFNFGGY